MTPVYQENEKKLDVIGHLEELRRRILFYLAVLVAATCAALFFGDRVLSIVTFPIRALVDKLVFIGPAEAFTSYIKISLLAGFVVSFPVLLFHFWGFISPAVSDMLRGRVAVWFITALCLFFAGILFGYFVAIPAALNFLLEFSRGIAVPMITLGKYISFFGALILVGGLVFEIPVFIGLLSDAEVLKVAVLKAKRHYAFLIIMILAAIITPTQDIFNMLLFAIPMILLYEIGIVVASKIERGKIASRE